MLIEVFDNRAYNITPSDKSKGISSERVPILIIKEENKEILEEYKYLRNLLSKLLNPENRNHSLMIKFDDTDIYNETNRYSFFFEILDLPDNLICGEIEIDKDRNIINYSRSINRKIIEKEPIIELEESKDIHNNKFDKKDKNHIGGISIEGSRIEFKKSEATIKDDSIIIKKKASQKAFMDTINEKFKDKDNSK